MEDFIVNVPKQIINNRTCRLREVLDTSNDILEICIKIFFKFFEEDSIKLAEMLTIILDPKKAYFRVNNQANNNNSNITLMVNYFYFFFFFS